MSVQYVHPIEVVEDVANEEGWELERLEEDDLTFFLGDLQIAFTWLEDENALHVACAFELEVPRERSAEVLILTARINVHLWVGHLDAFLDDGHVSFRHAHLLQPGEDFTPAQCRRMVELARRTCEQYSPAYYLVLRGMDPEQAFGSVQMGPTGTIQ